MDENVIDVACPSDKRDSSLKEWAARYKRKGSAFKSQAPEPGCLVRKRSNAWAASEQPQSQEESQEEESQEDSVETQEPVRVNPFKRVDDVIPGMENLGLGFGRSSSAMPGLAGMGLGRPSAVHTPNVVCPWEDFGDVDLKDLAAYGII